MTDGRADVEAGVAREIIPADRANTILVKDNICERSKTGIEDRCSSKSRNEWDGGQIGASSSGTRRNVGSGDVRFVLRSEEWGLG